MLSALSLLNEGWNIISEFFLDFVPATLAVDPTWLLFSRPPLFDFYGV